jgi:hypothetical protein
MRLPLDFLPIANATVPLPVRVTPRTVVAAALLPIRTGGGIARIPRVTATVSELVVFDGVTVVAATAPAGVFTTSEISNECPVPVVVDVSTRSVYGEATVNVEAVSSCLTAIPMTRV